MGQYAFTLQREMDYKLTTCSVYGSHKCNQLVQTVLTEEDRGPDVKVEDS